jgi:hypothetical protein
MKTTNISFNLNTSTNNPENRTYSGRGKVCYPFVVHRPKFDGEQCWVVSHLASGRQTFRAKTLKDAQKLVNVLTQFSVFLLPECEEFYLRCSRETPNIVGAIRASGYNRDSRRFE